MGVFKVKRDTYGGTNYLWNAVNYTMNKDAYPVVGSPNVDLDKAYSQMLCVKKYFEKINDNPLYHFIITYDKRKISDENLAINVTEQIANYFKDKYQVIWCVHFKRRTDKCNRCISLYHSHIVLFTQLNLANT